MKFAEHRVSPELLTVFNLPFAEQEAFFQNKLNIPTRKWDDLWKAQHAKGFMVAGAYKADILTDFRTAVDKAITKGTTLEEFRKDFDNIVSRHGWSYNGARNWRSEVIYSTNIRQAYNAARWEQLTDPEQLKVLPYLTYRHGDSRVPRLHHLAWDGVTLPHDDPWWQTHSPQNGWGCKCWVHGSTRKEYAAAQKAGKGEAPPSPIDPKTGEPVGIDKGWGYNVGEAYLTQTHDILLGKLASWPADIGAAAMLEMKAPARKVIEKNYDDFISRTLESGKARRDYALLGALDQEELNFLANKEKSPQSAGFAINDRLIVGKKAVRHQAAGNALTDAEWRMLPSGIDKREAVLYDRQDGKLLFVVSSLDDPRIIKVIVELDVMAKKLKNTINEATAVFKINKQALDNRRRYELVRGKI